MLHDLYYNSDLCNYTDKGTTHSYIPIYDLLFDRYEPPRTLLEIGVERGGSLALWAKYFEYQSDKIIGVDLNDRRILGKDKKLLIGNATDPATYTSLTEQLDIIIDDGSHVLHEQIRAFELLSPRLTPNGVYVIEDIQNDNERDALLKLAKFHVVDLRWNKGRYDDVMMIYKRQAI